MAADAGQSQLRWALPLLFLGALSGPGARAGDLDPSGFQPAQGDKFYLLTDATFSPDEMATVRLEAAGREHNLESYGGVDVRVYRVPSPIEFLKRQKNLHRPELTGAYTGEGLANTLDFVWDSLFKKSRLAWQRLISVALRKQAVSEDPELRQAPPHTYKTQFEQNPQFSPIPGFKVVEEFRYPVFAAQPIKPPGDVNLQGSSSEFLHASPGNVQVPLGRLGPGLYAVEAIAGSFRATALVFVSDSVAITKTSAHQLVTWVVDKKSGAAAPDAAVVVTDGVGTLASGQTGKDGIFVKDGLSLERNYVLGEDGKGGVFVSENFYYDSEIYGAKVMVFTDRPLYRPGDTVHVKILGRAFSGALSSSALPPGHATLTVIDATGTPLASRAAEIQGGAMGGQSHFRIPADAVSGGYALQLELGGVIYAAAFRVANFVKPLFELAVVLDKEAPAVGDEISGKVKLTYPSGEPVAGGTVEITARQQRLTIVDAEVRYRDRFPIEFNKVKLVADSHGEVSFALPKVTDPSRLVLELRGIDKASAHVNATKELMVQGATSGILLSSTSRLSLPKEKVTFTMTKTGEGGAHPPAHWRAVRLQDQTNSDGYLKGEPGSFDVTFEQAGSYSLFVFDQDENLIGSTTHWVEGKELGNIPGTITIVADKDAYKPGETAKLSLVFSEPVQEALLTMERDKVEQMALASTGGPWLKVDKIDAQQWHVAVPISAAMGPNFTLSVAYVSAGHYLFENKGIRIAIARVEVRAQADKEVYAPGDKVTVQLTSTLEGKPAPAVLTVGVVDELVYALQPEIAPDVFDFFYHARRNQVRTSASLSFHTFDAAASATGQESSPEASYFQRAVKSRDRPRRDEKDTAYWHPALKTDAAGKATITFNMPDSITRWRLTVRAMTDAGAVGQSRSYLRSYKDLYLKWAAPTALRAGDQVSANVIAFNLTGKSKKATLAFTGLDGVKPQELELAPGPNYHAVPLKPEKTMEVRSALQVDGKTVDELATTVRVLPFGWRSPQWLSATGAAKLPADATNVRLTYATQGAEAFLRVADDLADYPYGCVEQTASRVIPLALAGGALRAGGASPDAAEQVADRLASERMRLIHMAGPDAVFAWWGDMTHGSPLMTAYAYYADFLATAQLGVHMPESNWETVYATYAKDGKEESVLGRAIILWMATEMGLKTKTLTEGLAEELPAALARAGKTTAELDDSVVLGYENSELDVAMALVLSARLAKTTQANLGPAAKALSSARALLAASPMALPQAIGLLERKGAWTPADRAKAGDLLTRVSANGATMDRSLALAMLADALDFKGRAAPPPFTTESPGAGWVKVATALGRTQWRFKGAGVPALPPARGAWVPQVTYDSAASAKTTLPATLTRHLYDLGAPSPNDEEKDDNGESALAFTARPLAPGTKLTTSGVYLDEIVLTVQGNSPMRYGAVEVPLPPGASVEPTTWGMKVVDTAGSELALDDAAFQAGELSWTQGVPLVADTPVTIHRLIRFGQKGTFKMPPARYFKMYAPGQRVYEGGDSAALATVEIE